jgi:hypothetical protein
MAVVQDSRRWSCSHSLRGREATLRGVLTMILEGGWVSVTHNLLSGVSLYILCSEASRLVPASAREVGVLFAHARDMPG